jgi:hypothetical protein
LDDKADNVVVEELAVKYEGSTSNWTGSLYRGVDNGIFSLVYKEGGWFLNYQINMRKLFTVTSIMSAIMGIVILVNQGPWWVGLLMFLWLCGGNWVINLLRHGGVATDIALGIDEMICGKVEEPELEKIPGKLKSWF